MKTSARRKPGTDHCVPRRCGLDQSECSVSPRGRSGLCPVCPVEPAFLVFSYRRARLAGFSLLLLATSLRAQQPDTTAILQSARTAALTYSKSLPNFTCTESISRFDDWSDRGAWT